MATKEDHFSRKYPIQAEELRYADALPQQASWLIVELTNAVAAEFGQLSTFYYEMMSRPGKPSWLLSTPGVKKAKDAARREGGKRLGRSATKAPDWDTILCVATHCVPESERGQILARWAGWWMSYQKDSDRLPPGYTGPVIVDGVFHPPLADPAHAPDVATCVEMFQRQAAEREKQLEQLMDQAVNDRHLLAAREAQLAAITTDRDELQRAHVAITTELSAKDSDIARLSATITSLHTARDRATRAHEARAQALQEELSKQSVAAHQAHQDERDHRQYVALLLAHQAGSGETLPPKIAARTPELEQLLHKPFSPDAAPSAKRLAAYLQAHLSMAAVPAQELLAWGVFEAELAAFLHAGSLPTEHQLSALIGCCPAIAEYGFVLLEEAKADELIEKFTAEPVAETAAATQVTVAELLARHQRDTPITAEEPDDRDGGFVSLPALWILMVVVAAAAVLAGAITIVSTAFSPGTVTLRYERGTRPSERVADGVAPETLTWYELDATPRSTTFRLAVTGSDPVATGFTGTLRLEYSTSCAPVVAVAVRTMRGTQAVALTSSRTADMTRVHPPDPIGPRLVLTYQRVDSLSCAARMVWENPGVK